MWNSEIKWVQSRLAWVHCSNMSFVETSCWLLSSRSVVAKVCRLQLAKSKQLVLFFVGHFCFRLPFVVGARIILNPYTNILHWPICLLSWILLVYLTVCSLEWIQFVHTCCSRGWVRHISSQHILGSFKRALFHRVSSFSWFAHSSMFRRVSYWGSLFFIL